MTAVLPCTKENGYWEQDGHKYDQKNDDDEHISFACLAAWFRSVVDIFVRDVVLYLNFRLGRGGRVRYFLNIFPVICNVDLFAEVSGTC